MRNVRHPLNRSVICCLSSSAQQFLVFESRHPIYYTFKIIYMFLKGGYFPRRVASESAQVLEQTQNSFKFQSVYKEKGNGDPGS
jgi:hypothetical protein